eukprot:CAMPEP_0169403364 /NCGR_PEP_ID=MMETSP1017-20121227/55703_1 /TAXON_ID=342587 /ORGANISM="Karlodinium micrum, Strain CCMP2283" /LENGTH=42 /DNA_ID= /DNA_START= /DNA_END= /DNA_ORIENTATION=
MMLSISLLIGAEYATVLAAVTDIAIGVLSFDANHKRLAIARR